MTRYVQRASLSKIQAIPSQEFLLAGCIKSLLDVNTDTEGLL